MDAERFEEMVLSEVADRPELLPVALKALALAAMDQVDRALHRDDPELAERWQGISDGLEEVLERVGRSRKR